ncbi:MAG TPA: hypothetical protein VGD60_02535 [Candidatus Acidoferrales bacterium]
MKKRFAVMVLWSAAFSVGTALAAVPQSASVARTAPVTVAGESVPRLVQFNGTLKDAAARPVAGVVSVSFAIYAEQDGGTALWSETQNVLADTNGHYNVLLGSATSTGVPAELFGTGQSRWLGITVARQPEMTRVLMASVPYALKAADADTLGGLPASAFVTTQSLAGRTGTHSTVIATGGAPEAGALLPDVTPTGSGTTNFIPIWTSSTTLANSLMFQTGGNVGINTTTPAETLDVNGNSIFRGSFQLPPGHPATSASGFESHSFQFQASSFNSGTNASTTQSFGFRAEPLNNNTSNPSAVLDLFFIPNGGSTFQNTGVSFGAVGAPLLNLNATSASDIEDPSVLLTLNNPKNTEDNTGSIAIDFNPVVFSGTHPPAARIQVEDDGGSGAYIFFNLKQTGAVTDPLFTAMEIDDSGNVSIAGNLSKSSGTFKIDDPIDPAGKYLSHSFVESPDMMNIYNGTVVLDAKGEAVITMPDWFDALNRSFQYQLTAIGAPGPGIYVAEKVRDNHFKIAGGTPGLEISWQVTGVRHDAYAVAHPTPVEEVKPAKEQGHYIHPELFGAGPDKAVSAVRHQHSEAVPAMQPAVEQATAKPSAGSTD